MQQSGFLNNRNQIVLDVLYSQVTEGDRVENNNYQCIHEGPGKSLNKWFS